MSSINLYLLISLVAVISACPKLWWVKPAVDGLFVGGRPSNKQIKYLAEDGFKSIITLFNFTEAVLDVDVPASVDAERLAKSLGLQYGYIEPNVMNFKTLTAPRNFGVLYDSLPKPIYLHCFIGYSSFFVASSYFASRSKANPDFTPYMPVDEVYRKALSLGWDYAADDDLKQLMDQLGGKPTQPLRKLNMSLPLYNEKYWMAKPIYDNIYHAGQIQSDQLSYIKAAGFDTIINLRMDGEEVTLLNVKDNTGPDRQKTENLLKSRVDPAKPNSYISPASSVNYESINDLEFGAHVGYSEPKEREAVLNAGFKYIHLPTKNINKLTYDEWINLRDQIVANSANGSHVLIHSRIGVRAAVVALHLAAHKYDLSAEWLQQKVADLAYKPSSINPQLSLPQKPSEPSRAAPVTMTVQLLLLSWMLYLLSL